MSVTTSQTIMPAGITNYMPTAYTDAVLRFNSGASGFENRKDKYGATYAFITSSPQLLSQSDINDEKRSFERPIRIPVMKRLAITLIDGRACVIGGQEPTPATVTLSFTTKGFQIKVPQHMLRDNYFKATEFLAAGIYHGWHAYLAFMEAAAIAYLEANKSTVLATSPYFTTGTGVYTGTTGTNFYSAYQYAMGLNYLNAGSDFLDVTNAASQVTKLLMGMNGPGNTINQAGLLGAENQYFTNFLTVTGGVVETHYLFTKGAVGLYHWVSPNAAARHVHIQENDLWRVEKDPVFGYFPASLHYQAGCVDSAIGVGGASEPVYYDKYEYTIDTSFVKQYSSVSGESPIYKFNLSAPA